MRYLGFLVSLFVSILLGVILNMQIGSVPPIGKLLDPNHGFWQNCYSEDRLAQEFVSLQGLSAPVKVVYDEHLVPHIFAQNESDLYRTQGYVTAQHRLWQMEFQTMAAAGRISEIVGPIALELDRMTRRKGLAYSAEQAEKFIQKEHPETYRLMEAYADGVNQYIAQLSKARTPLEYKILNYEPEQWSVYKSALLLKYMADMLVGDKDLDYTNTRKLIGQEWFAKLFPEFPAENDPVIEKERVWDFQAIQVPLPEGINYPDSLIVQEPLPNPEDGVGSNNWAVSGKKTKSGNPILANDPHLSLNLPSLWYAMQLSTPDYSAKGATLPGALGIISGFNEHIAWGVTNATRDLRDWYSIKFKDLSRKEYFYNNQWIPTTFRVEEIKVKGQEIYYDTVAYTHHGPVVFDRSFRNERQDVNFSLKWTAHMESNEQQTFLSLNKGKNHADYLEALDFYTSPAQNFVFASREGDIAMKVQGRFPLKWKGQGKFLMDGSDPRYEWSGFIPFEQNPSTLNPERGFVSSANQHSVDQSYPYYIFDNSFEHYRNRRLNAKLYEMSGITLDDMKSLQFDNFHLHAAEALPIMLGLMDSVSISNPNAEKFLSKLRSWNYNTFPNQEEPTLFQSWWKHLYDGIWGKWRKEKLPVVLPNKYETTRLLRDEPVSTVLDDPKTEEIETAQILVEESFGKMVAEIEKWDAENGDYTWANYKGTSINHLVPTFKSFSYDKVYTGGGAGILNATSERNGASWRMVVELGDEVKAFGIYPGGQSGNPGSKFYDNFIKRWANGEYLNFDLRKADDLEGVLFETELRN
ncbi:penicillin acylase family protein [Mariniradius sediminis]|uniref:Penicillin acylase family protein n=1 Tax=Mariniradius sediminis TaxID=2909237 RepID=A0ABS9BZ62_9BACT|nr:penicillin acylase family protein [Mariniradius sediminis]MCF1752584.1 penicillin acylase family protein [Mariniradius sediminis]